MKARKEEEERAAQVQHQMNNEMQLGIGEERKAVGQQLESVDPNGGAMEDIESNTSPTPMITRRKADQANK